MSGATPPPGDPQPPVAALTGFAPSVTELAAELAAAISARSGWVYQGRLNDLVVAEYQPALGRPGGSVTGGSRGWWWTAYAITEAGDGIDLGSNTPGLPELTAAAAVAAVEQAVAFPPASAPAPASPTVPATSSWPTAPTPCAGCRGQCLPGSCTPPTQHSTP